MPVTLIVAVLVSLALVVVSNTCLGSALPPHPLLKTRAIIITPTVSVRWVPPFVNDLLKSLLSQTKQSALVSISRDTEKRKDRSPARSETPALSNRTRYAAGNSGTSWPVLERCQSAQTLRWQNSPGEHQHKSTRGFSPFSALFFSSWPITSSGPRLSR